MFYVLSLVIAIILILIIAFFAREKKTLNNLEEWGVGLAVVLVLVGFMGGIIAVPCGLCTYPTLIGKQAEIRSLENNINSVKDGYYQEKTSSDALINGSLTNMQQSKPVTEYLVELANKKAEFNKDLALAKVNRKMKAIRWFGHGMFISDEIYKLKEVK